MTMIEQKQARRTLPFLKAGTPGDLETGIYRAAKAQASARSLPYRR